LRSIALSVFHSSGILIEGIGGCGKSMLLEELANITGNTGIFINKKNKDMIKIHLDESFDSKDLFGTYICTDIPGEFKWKPGALLNALTEGRWILIEDIDLASFDVISSLIPLIETNSIYVQALNEIVFAANGFKIFATASLTETYSGVTKRNKSKFNINKRYNIIKYME
jgi:midasin